MALTNSEIIHTTFSAAIELIVGEGKNQRGFSIGPELEKVKLVGEKNSGQILVTSTRSRGLAPRPLSINSGNALVRLKREGTAQEGIKTWTVLQQATLIRGLPGTGDPVKALLAKGQGVGDGETQLAVDGRTVFIDASVKRGNRLTLQESQEANGVVIIREI